MKLKLFISFFVILNSSSAYAGMGERNQTIYPTAIERQKIGKVTSNQIIVACLLNPMFHNYYLSPVFIEKFFSPETGKPIEQWWTGSNNRGICDPKMGRFRKIAR